LHQQHQEAARQVRRREDLHDARDRVQKPHNLHDGEN
jgi:hypothetical protein